ncbi:class I SAM-dependent methyltransferase [bacterium]|nr:class I SAM-dependent methyltransferase [bacterium]
MPKIQPFERHFLKYERWFEHNEFVYLSELKAVRKLLTGGGKAMEIGSGSGQFAVPLGVKIGIEPSTNMRKLAKEKGMEVIGGVAEALPFKNEKFDIELMVTTICFLDDLEAALNEVYRTLKPGGAFIVGFIDKKSYLGKLYQKKKKGNVFYEIADFYGVDELIDNLKAAGFKQFEFAQTIFHGLWEIKQVEPLKNGCGEGSFVVIKAVKP